jgi:hypothetical protein
VEVRSFHPALTATDLTGESIMATGNRTTSKAFGARVAKATNEPLLPLWHTVRAAWAAEAASEGDNGPTVKAYRAAFAAFDKVKPTTTLGLFLTVRSLLDREGGAL